MLAIRPDQLELFRRQAQTRQELRLARHFQQFYPRECKEAGEPNVLKVVHAGIEKAATYGYLSLQQAGYTVGLMFMLGIDFDVDPQVPWAAERLRDPKISDPGRRIQAAYEAAVEYLGKTAGSACENVVKAMVRLKAWDLKSPAPGTATWGGRDLRDARTLLPREARGAGRGGDAGARPEGARRSGPLRHPRRVGVGPPCGPDVHAGERLRPRPALPVGEPRPGHPTALLGEAARVSSLHREALNHVATSLSSK
jgi:hypothetical protein